jgi:hypothetical protein
MLKADLHIHTSEDPADGYMIKYSAKEMIDYGAKLGFDVISITNHNSLLYNKELADYAEKKGILLIPGTELKLDGKDVLVYNVGERDLKNIKHLNDLSKLNKESLIIAAHPFYHAPQCIGNKLYCYREFFDGVEYCNLYTRLFNPNKKAVWFAKKYNLSVIGNSDAHRLTQINGTYSLIDAEKNIRAVIGAIRNNKVRIITKPVSYYSLIRVAKAFLIFHVRERFQKFLGLLGRTKTFINR